MATASEPAPKTSVNGSFKKRVLSASLLAPAALAAIYVGGAVFAAIVAFAVIVMAYEWARMVEGRDFTRTFFALAAGGAVALALAAAGRYGFAFAACAGAGALSAIATMPAAKRPAWAAFGAAYILAPSVALIWLRNDVPEGRALTLMLFLIVWGADSGGYFAGKLVGGPRMSPAISPAKTWAGAVGGLILGAISAMVTAKLLWTDALLANYALIGGSLGLASILGDMAESAFKRVFGVKDSSNLIPGHGGFLDRLDGMIFATTAMTLVLYVQSEWGRVPG